MEFSDRVRLKAARHLEPLAAFTAEDTYPESIGIYQSVECPGPLRFTTEGVTQRGMDGWDILPYRDMVKVECPTTKTGPECTLLGLQMADGRCVDLWIRGRSGRLLDLYCVADFFKQLIFFVNRDDERGKWARAQELKR